MGLRLKNAFSCVVVITIILILSNFSFAQKEEITGVILNDGRTIYGKVVEMNIDRVRIETDDGRVESYKFADVVNFIKDKPSDQNKAFKKDAVVERPPEKVEKEEIKDIVVERPPEKGEEITVLEESKPLKTSRHIWEISNSLSYIEYKEPGVMSEKGPMYGVDASYSYRHGVMLQLEGRFGYAQVDYDGYNQAGAKIKHDDIDDYLFEARGLIGYEFNILSSTTLTPYAGLGYRYLNDNLQDYFGGYERESNYLYLPVGIEIITGLKNNWCWGAAIEYDYFLSGKQKSHLSDFDPGLNDIDNKQDKGYGLRGVVKFVRKGQRVNFFMEPFIRYWKPGFDSGR